MGVGGGKKGGKYDQAQPQRSNRDTQGKKSNLLCSVAPPGGKRSDGWGDERVMGSLKAKLFEREVL